MRASVVLAPGSWEAAAEVLLDFDARHRRRVVLHTTLGDVLLDLPQAARLRDGDGLALDDGRTVRVRARAESLLEVSGDAAGLVRIAWHLGNRHLPVQFAGGVLRIRADHVIAHMVEGLGGTVSACEAPFDPEAGAYAPAQHAHDHGHAHD